MQGLQLLLEHSWFLADLPLIHVRSVSWDAFEAEASIMF